MPGSSRLLRIKARLRLALLAPSRAVTDVAERRRAGLLAFLQLTQGVQLSLTVVAVAASEPGAMRTVIPRVMVVVLGAILVSYALVRTRYVQAALWLYLAANLAMTPAVLLALGPIAGIDPFVSLAFLLPAILLAGAVSSARVTLLTGLVGLASTGATMYLIGPATWHRPMGYGFAFVLGMLGLVLAFGVHRDRVEADRSVELRARNEELEALRCTLESRVHDRTAELAIRNLHARLVLDNVAEGVFTIDCEGRFVGAPSAALVRWFGEPTPHDTFHHYFAARAPEFAARAHCAWSQVVDDVFPIDVALAQIPAGFEDGPRAYTLTFQPIDSGAERCFLVVVADVTAERQRVQMQEEGREHFALFQHMLRDRAGLRDFMRETEAGIGRLLGGSADLVEFAREVHTLKGNALSLGLESVGRLCHELEEGLDRDREVPTQRELAPLAQRWARLTADAQRILAERKDGAELSSAQVARLEAAVLRAGDEDLATFVRSLAPRELHAKLQGLARQAERVAERLGKRVEIETDVDAAYFDVSHLTELWPVLVHAVRNALDHGIEAPELRARAGKPAAGKLWVRAREESGALWIEIEDDGRGIDRSAFGRSVADDELLDLLCSDGFSTAETVTDTSGRGVGMGALRHTVERLGGGLQLRSRAGQGTCLRLRVPTSGQPNGVSGLAA